MDITTIFIFSFVIAMVTSNPLVQRYYIQRNPQTYLQRTLPIEIPLEADPKSNICPCTQGVLTQNQIAQQINTQSTANTRLNELLYNKVVLNPNLQAILSSQSPQNNAVIRNSDTQTSTEPKIINNYIILPVEFLENTFRDQRDTHKSHGDSNKASKRNKPKNSLKDNEGNSLARRKSKNKQTPSDNVGDGQKNKFSKKTGGQKQDLINFTSANDKFFSDEPEIKKYNKNQRQQKPPNNLPESDNEEVIEMIEKLTNNKINKRVKLSNEFNDLGDLQNESMKIYNQIPQNAQNRHIDTFTSPKTFNFGTNNNFLPKNYRDETLIKILQDQFPDVPEELIKTLMSYLKQQLRHSNPYNLKPNFNYPTFYDQIFKSQFPFYGFNFNPFNQYSWNSPDHGKFSQNRKRKSQRNKSNNSDVEKKINNTEITLKQSMKLNEESHKFFTVPVNNKNINNQEIEVSTDEIKTIEEKKSENIPIKYISYDKVNSDSHLLNDYYPNFTSDNTYFINSENSKSSNVHDDRYVYSTDLHNSELNHGRRKHDQKYNNSSKPNKSEQKNVFDKIPPKLEEDIQKKHSEKSVHSNLYEQNVNFDSNDEPYKISSGTNVKTQHISQTKNTECPRSKNNKHANIETVYANSKVTKYGPTTEYSELISPEDDNTYVIARSRSEEEW